jgi:adenosylmethionine-8-amino-7-oxononanoate aminotransferase
MTQLSRYFTPQQPPHSDLLSRDYATVWHPYGRDSDYSALLPISHGDGALLITEDGRQIIDAISSWWVNLHGHAHPKLTAAIANQASKLSQAIFGSCTHEPAVQLAEALLKSIPANHSSVFYSDDGSTAVEVALKLTLQFWLNRGKPRSRFIALSGAYHGDTFGAMSVSERGVFNSAFNQHLFSIDHLPFPGTPEEATQCLDALDIALSEGSVAAVIVEPLVQGAAGMRMYDVAVLDEITKRSHDQGSLVIFDEVMTGFGRLGSLFASNLVQNQPDLICLSKGITGGMLPLGATTMTAEIREACRSEETQKTFFHGHSFTGNALSCACALASFELVTSPDCVTARERIGAQHRKFLAQLADRYPSLQTRSLGTICAVDMPHETPTGYVHPLRNILLRRFLADNVLLRPLGNTVYIIPPYCITEEQLGRVYQSIWGALEDLERY